METIRFEWDPDKDLLNRQKHNVSFDEARSVFYDDHAWLIPDPDHSPNEDRYILLGHASTLRFLVVVHCYRQQDEVIRIISARKATRHEQKYYTRGR